MRGTGHCGGLGRAGTAALHPHQGRQHREARAFQLRCRERVPGCPGSWGAQPGLLPRAPGRPRVQAPRSSGTTPPVDGAEGDAALRVVADDAGAGEREGLVELAAVEEGVWCFAQAPAWSGSDASPSGGRYASGSGTVAVMKSAPKIHRRLVSRPARRAVAIYELHESMEPCLVASRRRSSRSGTSRRSGVPARSRR